MLGTQCCEVFARLVVIAELATGLRKLYGGRPAAGPVRFVALFTAAPLHVAAVEARLRKGGLAVLAGAYPQLQALAAEVVAP
ncbi:MAG TPA: hypothetical protein VMF89_05145 [Polyangiales bacterium]|nr:hypothetical protein [Polyangiales bacterium]